MTEIRDEYPIRVAAYRLMLTAHLSDAEFSAAIDRVMNDPPLHRGVVAYLIALGFAGLTHLHGGDQRSAINMMVRELRIAEQLDDIKPDDIKPGDDTEDQ